MESNYLKKEEGLRQRSCFSWRTNFYLVRRNAKGGDHRKGISTMTSFQLQGMKHFDQDNDKSIKLWKSSATFLKARSVLGGAFRPTVITLLPVNPWLPPVRFPNWSLSQIQRKMNIRPPFIQLSHPAKEDHLSIGRELLCHILCQSVLYTWPQ